MSIKQLVEQQDRTWRAMADADIPYKMKRVYTITVDLQDRMFRHKFTCTAHNPIAAVNKYLWHVRSHDTTVTRIRSINHSDIPKDAPVKSVLTIVYPF